MSSKEKSEVDEVPNLRASETVQSKDLEESLDASKAESSVVEEPREEFLTAGKLSDLALTNLINNAINCLSSNVKIKQRSAAFRELSKAVKVMEDFNLSHNENSVCSEKLDSVAKKTEMLKILAAMSELSMIDAASVAAKYTLQYDLALRERNSLTSYMESGKAEGKKCENQTKVQFAPGLEDHENQRDSKCESLKATVKGEKSSPAKTLKPESGSDKCPDCSDAAEPAPGSSDAEKPVPGSSDSAEPVSGSSDSAEPVSGSSDSAEPVSGSSDAVEPVSGSSVAPELVPVTNPSDNEDLLTASSGIGDPSSEVSDIDPSSEVSEIEPSVASETGELGKSEFERQTSATTQTSECSDFAAMPVLSSGQESSAVESNVLELCSELSRAEPADESAAGLSAKQEFSRTQTVSSSTKKKQTDLEGFIFLHLSIEYIALVEKERNNDIDAILAVLFKVEDDLKKKIDKQVLRTFQVQFEDVGEGILKFKNVGHLPSASSYFSENTFSESFLPSHAWSLAGTSASSIQTDSPLPESQLGESGRVSELRSSSENSARQSRQSSISESMGPSHDLSRSRSESLDEHQQPPEKRVRANSPKEGYPFIDGEKSFEFQGTPLSLDVKNSQETSLPQDEAEAEVEKSKSDVKEEKSSGYHEDASKKS